MSFSNNISGLNAASLQLSVSANNIAKAPVQGASRERVTFSTTATGGVQGHVQSFELSEQQKQDVTEFNPNSISIADEFIVQDLASFAFKANLNALKIQNETFDSLLDIHV